MGFSIYLSANSYQAFHSYHGIGAEPIHIYGSHSEEPTT